jgi:hypothetical protein
MQFHRLPPAFVVFLAGVLLGPACIRAENALQVTGIDGASQSWTADQLKSVFAADLKPVEFTTHGQKHTAEGVPLLAVLAKVGVSSAVKMDPKADPHVKSFNIRLAVVVQATDGYTATFSLAELLPDFGNRDVWLILSQDGMPLSKRDGVAKLVVPQDVKNSRWVHDIASVTVVNPVPAATQPSGAPSGK